MQINSRWNRYHKARNAHFLFSQKKIRHDIYIEFAFCCPPKRDETANWLNERYICLDRWKTTAIKNNGDLIKYIAPQKCTEEKFQILNSSLMIELLGEKLCSREKNIKSRSRLYSGDLKFIRLASALKILLCNRLTHIFLSLSLSLRIIRHISLIYSRCRQMHSRANIYAYTEVRRASISPRKRARFADNLYLWIISTSCRWQLSSQAAIARR